MLSFKEFVCVLQVQILCPSLFFIFLLSVSQPEMASGSLLTSLWQIIVVFIALSKLFKYRHTCGGVASTGTSCFSTKPFIHLCERMKASSKVISQNKLSHLKKTGEDVSLSFHLLLIRVLGLFPSGATFEKLITFS